MKELYEFLINKKITKKDNNRYCIYTREEYGELTACVLMDNIDQYNYFKKNIPGYIWLSKYFDSTIESTFNKMPDYPLFMVIQYQRNGARYKTLPWSTDKKYIDISAALEKSGFKKTDIIITPDQFNPEFWSKNNWHIEKV